MDPFVASELAGMEIESLDCMCQRAIHLATFLGEIIKGETEINQGTTYYQPTIAISLDGSTVGIFCSFLCYLAV